jgi:hypothetical protein
MEKKINKIIESFRHLRRLKEDGIVNSVGTGGLTNLSTPSGRLDGFDPVMSLKKRQIKLPSGQRKRWMKSK